MAVWRVVVLTEHLLHNLNSLTRGKDVGIILIYASYFVSTANNA